MPLTAYFKKAAMGFDEQAKLNYMQWHKELEEEKPYQLVSEDLPELYGIPRQNFEIKEAPSETIIDIRGLETNFNLDEHAFVYLRHQFRPVNYFDEEEVESVYKPELEDLLKKNIAGVDEVCFFNWRVWLQCTPHSGHPDSA